MSVVLRGFPCSTYILIRVLMFRQDSLDNQDIIFLPFQRKAKSIIPLRGKAFTHCGNKTVMQGEKYPLLIPRSFFPLKRNCVFSASSGSREKIKSIQLILSENPLFQFCLLKNIIQPLYTVDCDQNWGAKLAYIKKRQSRFDSAVYICISCNHHLVAGVS